MATKISELDATIPTTIEAENTDDLISGLEESDDEGVEVMASGANKKEFEEEYVIIQGDFNIDFELLKMIPCPYTDIIAEFADVEIFMISVDSLLLELSAHHYHNWVLGGQTTVLAEQIVRFLTALDDLNAKFILIWFSDFKPLYEKDQFLQFLHEFIIGYLSTSKWADAMECFASPLDEKWSDFLYRLTPSFLLVSLEDPSRNFVHESIDFTSRFISIAVQLITLAIPVVFFNGFTISFASVMAYRLSTVTLAITNFESKISAFWQLTSEQPPSTIDPSAVYACKSVAEFWANVIQNELKAVKTSGKSAKSDQDFECFCIAVLISALVCEKLGTSRVYDIEDAQRTAKGPPPAANHGRRRLFSAAIKILEVVEWSKINFVINDLWDGRMILAIYMKIASKSEVLPFRLQDEFAKLHGLAGLTVSVPTDTSDKLLDPLATPEKKAQKLLIDEWKLCKVNNKLFHESIPEARELIAAHESSEDSEELLQKMLSQFPKWKFEPVPDRLLESEKERIKNEKEINSWRLSRSRIMLSRWYQNFADSLEGRGNDLIVDFSRTPRLPTITETSEQVERSETKPSNGVTKKGGGGKPGSGGGKKGGAKGGKDLALSKKEQILKANRDRLVKEQIENDKKKITFATHVKAQAISALDDVFRKLELDESKALCVYEKVIRHMELFSDRLSTITTLEQKRLAALDLVGALKFCTTKFYHYLDDSQKEKINNYWVLLGFVKSSAKRRAVDRIYDLEINLVDYQLFYGGRLIDILSDPRKDDRVVGFSPDGWQRKMLDVVDEYKSALIIAPTSAGKTFVSYYCIEKVLRSNNDDVVVYVSPSKALMNQVIGSVYARFRNKPMVGGKALHGTFTLEYSDNCLNCQVLATIPECLEIMLLSTDPVVQQFVSRIRYVILDEVHCINSFNQPGQIWEHIFLLIRCPFLALSATISNVEMVRNWLQTAENVKAISGEKARKVELITYDERWSELELAIASMREFAGRDASVYFDELDVFNRGGSVASVFGGATSPDQETVDDALFRPDSPSVELQSMDSRMHLLNDLILAFHPYGVYKPEKLKMFGIPADQRLTARQIVELYSIMAEIDPKVKDQFEPSKYFGYEIGTSEFKWLNRFGLREYETKLKETFLEWLKTDVEKTNKVFNLLDANVHEEFEKRSRPFNMRVTALHNIVPVMDSLKNEDRLPALCFNDDRDICERLAVRLFTEMETREFAHLASADFKRRFNFKAEDKAAKLAKRKRDAESREKKKKANKGKKKGDDHDDDGGADDARDWDDAADASDQFLLQKIRLEEELKKFKFYGRWSDEDIYNKTLTRLLEKGAGRQSTQQLSRLFKRGIGFHHEGLTAIERAAVEILFRAGFLGIVFSTSTLALGMNMPCKTVIFGIDTPMLSPLQYRQMSGRAGRRGFDPSGTVIFMSLPTSKIRRLLTSSLATLRGNVPYTTSFLLKLFGYVKGLENSAFTTEEIAYAASGTQPDLQPRKKNAAIDTTDVTTTTIRRLAALTLLRAPLVMHTRHERHFNSLERLLKYLTFFNVQMLRKYNFLNEKCEFTGFAYLATHLSNFEPGNLVFTILLESGVLHEVEKFYDDTHNVELKDTLVNILAHIFTNKFLPVYSYDNDEAIADAPILKPMPEKVEKILADYENDIDKLLLACLQLASPTRHLENKGLRISGKCSSFDMKEMDIISVLDPDLIHDASFVPNIRLNLKDHRGRKIYRNSYAYDFWKRGDRKNLVDYNKLSISEIWYLINAFTKVLQGINAALIAMARPKDPIRLLIEQITKEYAYKFKRAFGMLKKGDEKEEKEE